jgi:hypothetical protein
MGFMTSPAPNPSYHWSTITVAPNKFEVVTREFLRKIPGSDWGRVDFRFREPVMGGSGVTVSIHIDRRKILDVTLDELLRDETVFAVLLVL